MVWHPIPGGWETMVFFLEGRFYFLFMSLTVKFLYPENFGLHQKFQYGLITMASMCQWIRFVYNAHAVEQKN